MSEDTSPSLVLPRRQTPLLPEAGAAGAPLMTVLAVLAFIASLALAGYLMVSRAASEWTGDLSGTITVQVRGAAPDIVDQQAIRVMTLLDGFPGVVSATRMSRAETLELLEPWIGQSNLSADIPVPVNITAEISPALRQDLSDLRTAIAGTAPLASLDDHGVWNDRLVRAAGKAQSLAFIILAMITFATASVIVFAARAGLAANRSTVEVMHLVGATDKFIADQVQKRYFSLGLRGGAIGAGLAAVLLFLMARLGVKGDDVFLPDIQLDSAMLGWLSLVPLVICATASIAARVTVRRILASDIH